MKSWILTTILLSICSIHFSIHAINEELPLYYWQQSHFVNFGDYLSLKLVERIVGEPVKTYRRNPVNKQQKLLAIGSILFFAEQGDVIWGTGTNGKKPYREQYSFDQLDIRAVRGPLTREFLWKTFQIEAPEIYGDPALLIPYFFPEFTRKEHPSKPYIVIPHYSENKLFAEFDQEYIVYPTEPWNEVIEKILDSEFVISSSLHGIIVAEAYGIPARWLRISEGEPLLKYHDYYLGTGRKKFQYATSVKDALKMGGECGFVCDLQKLYEAFPFEFWPTKQFHKKLPLVNTCTLSVP